MKRFVSFLGLAAALLSSCATQEVDFPSPVPDDMVFHAGFEQPEVAGTRVHADAGLLLRWNANDLVSIFNKVTVNQPYRFAGETGDPEGEFTKVRNGTSGTGNAIPHVVSVYPYRESTRISDTENLTLTLPAIQPYALESFGPETNTMVSRSADERLQYRNVCGYLAIRLYGEGISVSSITLKGNNGEKLAGNATVSISPDGVPVMEMASGATSEITLSCDTPVALGATMEESTVFWMVVPPVDFSKGFTISVQEFAGGVSEKSTSKSITIQRNHLSRMAPVEVETVALTGNIDFKDPNAKSRCVEAWDINGDGELSYEEAAAVTDLPEGYFSGSRMTGFDELAYFTGLTTIPSFAFFDCRFLKSVIVPAHVREIADNAFNRCDALEDIHLPDGLERIGDFGFSSCLALEDITLPETLTEIGAYAFNNCPVLGRLVCLAGTPPMAGEEMFNGSRLQKGWIIVPEGSVDSYGKADYWKDYFHSLITPEEENSPVIDFKDETVRAICVRNWDRNGDGELSRREAAAVSDPSTYFYYQGSIVSFDEFVYFTGMTDLPDGYFYYCSSLECVTLPETVSSIGQYAFEGCASLQGIVIPDGVSFIEDRAFYDCTSLECVTLPGSLTGVGDCSFFNCRSLKNLVFPEGVTSIGANALDSCEGLETLVFPASLTRIGPGALMSCHGLKDLEFLSVFPPEAGKDSFWETGDGMICVPEGSVAAYKEPYYWDPVRHRITTRGHAPQDYFYCSTDFSSDGDVIQLQQATAGRGIDLLFMGDGFVDKDMAPGGKYETALRQSMEQFFTLEPYRTFRDRFNVWGVKVISRNDEYQSVYGERRLTVDSDKEGIGLRWDVAMDYADAVPNPYGLPRNVAVITNTKHRLGKSFCMTSDTEGSVSLVLDDLVSSPFTINHEMGGHGFAKLADEYVEGGESNTSVLNEQGRENLDNSWLIDGWDYNLDWRNDPETVRWSHLLKDPKYAQEGLGIFEGAGFYRYGVYRPTMNSVMRYLEPENKPVFNAPSREQVYRTIMRYSEGEDWTYGYEAFVTADEAGRQQARESFSAGQTSSLAPSDHGIPPIHIHQDVSTVFVSPNGKVTLR